MSENRAIWPKNSNQCNKKLKNYN